MIHLLFNSHPHKEDDFSFLLQPPILHFSTHILTWRMTAATLSLEVSKNFQLTSSQGGWLRLLLPDLSVRLFNSHPHKEDDFKWTFIFRKVAFSTHILTRRMTCVIDLVDCQKHFSTHILTRRMTRIVIKADGGIIFQLTSSQGGWQHPIFLPVFWSVFQLTSSQGGWLYNCSNLL